MNLGGIVLCGGQSCRMGASKATLPFGDETMVTRVLRLLGEVVRPLVVVASVDQELPLLPETVIVARDRGAGRGPLEGLYCGLAALQGRASAAYVSGCDVPLLVPAFVRKLFSLLERNDAVVPRETSHCHPLSAVYRVEVLGPISEMLARDERRVISFFERVATRYVDVDELRDVDPELHSLVNLNNRDDYERALCRAGLGGEKGFG